MDLKVVNIPAGSFLMGDQGDQHKVTLNPFMMGQTQVTQKQWKIVARFPKIKIDLTSDPSEFNGDDIPVHNVSWKDAIEFCARLSNYTGYTVTLPTEAQWEYACRAGTKTIFCFGSGSDTGMFTDRHMACSPLRGPVPVMTYPLNPWGLADMHGNVCEWCLDTWHGSYEGAPTDGSSWLTGGTGSIKLLRGGSWFSHPRLCSSAYRSRAQLDYASNFVGFRVVCIPT
jgi:formylglycine-generating enzyme required for sulfatase activity